MTNEYPVVCGCCNGEYQFRFSPEERNGCTTDCPLCDALLICLEDGSTADFHAWLHKETEGSWPDDGNGTASVKIDGKGVRFYDG